jgi:cell division protein FtsB
MSLKSEVAELIDWLGELATKEPSGPPPIPLPREDWLLVRKDLERAVAAFREAGNLVAAQADQSAKSVLADLAFDLANETQVLADRAFVISRRARPKVAKSADELAEELASVSKRNESLTTQVANLKEHVAALESGAQKAEAKVRKPPEPKVIVAADKVQSGQTSLTTARKNLFNVTPAEQVVVDFAEDLDLLDDLVEGWRRVERRKP